MAFVGKNGMGKTTLSKCIAEQLDFKGDLVLGSNLSLGFLPNIRRNYIEDKRV